MKLYYVTSFFFLFIFLTFNPCSRTVEKENSIPISQIEEFDIVISSIKKDTAYEGKIQLINSYLRKIEKTEYDSLRYITLMFKTSLHSKNKEIDSAIYFSNRLYTISKNNSDSLDMAKALTKLGFYYKSNNELIKAFENYNESFKISELLNDNINAGKALHSMSKIQNSIGDFVGSKATAISGFEFLENTDDIKTLSGLCHNISVVLKEEGKYKEALKYNAKALKLANNDSALMKIGRANFLKYKNTKANILREQQQFKEAIFIYDKLLSNPIVISNIKEYARVLDNKGYTLWLENDDNNESLKLMLDALELRNKNNYTSGLIANNIHLAEYFFEEDKSMALEYAEKAYMKSKSIGSMDDILESLDMIIILSDATKKQIENSLSLEYSNISNKLREIKNKTQEIYATTKYSINEEKKKTEKQKLAKEEEKRSKQLYLLLAVSILCISAFLFSLLKSKHKKKTLQEVYNTETRISKKVHDEVANDVFQVMTTLQNNTNVNEKVIDDLDHIYSKTRNIAKEHSVLDYDGNFENTLNDLLLSYNSETVNVIIKNISKVNWMTISKMNKETIYKVLQELMVNMKKHSQAEIVALTFNTLRKKAVITYSDNGIGCTLKKNTGLQNVENRIQSINGTIKFESEINKGFKANITV